jgi:carbon monoxide dehydrogenase subunit G
MADFRSSVVIHRPVEEVFHYVVSMENVHELMPNVVKMEKQTEGPLKAGTIFLETRLISGRNIQAEVEMTEYTENQSFATKTNSNGLITEYKYHFHPVEEGTQVDLEAHITTTGLKMRLTKPILVKMIKREDGSQLVYLKEMFEQEKTEGKEE